jgi:hypothetical protein
MARIFTESFEGDHLLQWGTGNGYVISNAVSLDGSVYAGACAGGGRYGDFSVTANAELYIGLYYYGPLINDFPFQWFGSGSQLGYVYVDNGTKELRAFDGTTTYGSGKILTANTTYHIQAHVVISNTVGVIQLRLNDVLVLDQQNIDTQPGAVTQIDLFRIGESSGVSYQDSIVVNDTTGSADNSWPGIVRFRVGTVVGPGFYVNNWNRNTGATNWQAVAEIPPDGDTTYLYTSTASTYESFSMNNPVISFANFRALRTMAVVKKDTGTVKLALGIRDLDNNTDYYSAGQDVGTSYVMVQDRRTLDPSTSMSWTQAGIGNVQSLIISAG